VFLEVWVGVDLLGDEVYLGFLIWPFDEAMGADGAWLTVWVFGFALATRPDSNSPAMVNIPSVRLTSSVVWHIFFPTRRWVRERFPTERVRRRRQWVRLAIVNALLHNEGVFYPSMRTTRAALLVPLTSATCPAFRPQSMDATKLPTPWMILTRLTMILPVLVVLKLAPPVVTVHVLIQLIFLLSSLFIDPPLSFLLNFKRLNNTVRISWDQSNCLLIGLLVFG
jgi:hypothetical protein